MITNSVHSLLGWSLRACFGGVDLWMCVVHKTEVPAAGATYPLHRIIMRSVATRMTMKSASTACFRAPLVARAPVMMVRTMASIKLCECAVGPPLPLPLLLVVSV